MVYACVHHITKNTVKITLLNSARKSHLVTKLVIFKGLKKYGLYTNNGKKKKVH